MLLPRLLRSPGARSLTQALASQTSRLQTRSFASSWRLQNLTIEEDSLSKLPNIDPSKLNVTETITPKQLVPNQDLIFGRTFTGMLLV